MVRIAVIADIHGNLPALRAVMADLERTAPDQVIVDGDLVGRGPQSREVLDIIAAAGWPVVQGNHEAFWVDCLQGRVPSNWDDGWWEPIRMALGTISKELIDWMDALPAQHLIELPGAPTIQIVHGSPRRNNEGFYVLDSDETILEALNSTPHPIVVGAHTHVPLDRRVENYRVLNPGSVGAPFNHDPAAQYMLLSWDGKDWQAALQRVAYDREETFRVWRETGIWDAGIAAQVFGYELQTASFHFWHYVRYCKENDLPLNDAASFVSYRQHTNGHH